MGGPMLLLAAAALAPAADTPAEVAKREAARLQGNWVLAEVEMGGYRVQVPPQAQGHTRLTFSGESFTIFEGAGKHEGKYRFTANPGEVDFTAHDATLHGIYRVEGETLTVCTSAGGERPAALQTKEDDGFILQVYRRERPGGPGDAAAAQELKRLEGVWELLPPAGEAEKPKEGEKPPPKTHLVIRGGEATWVVGGKQAGEAGRLWVNPATKPKVLSLQAEDLRIDGSYELEGNSLTLRYHALPYGERKVLTLRRVAR